MKSLPCRWVRYQHKIWISPRNMNGRRFEKPYQISKECFVRYPNTSKSVKTNSAAHCFFNPLLSVKISWWHTLSRVWYITRRKGIKVVIFGCLNLIIITLYFVQSWCDLAKVVFCNTTNWESVGATMRRCELKCCSEDKCNDVGSSKAASFIITFPSLTVIFVAGFFVHC